MASYTQIVDAVWPTVWSRSNLIHKSRKHQTPVLPIRKTGSKVVETYSTHKDPDQNRTRGNFQAHTLKWTEGLYPGNCTYTHTERHTEKSYLTRIIQSTLPFLFYTILYCYCCMTNCEAINWSFAQLAICIRPTSPLNLGRYFVLFLILAPDKCYTCMWQTNIIYLVSCIVQNNISISWSISYLFNSKTIHKTLTFGL